MDRKRQLARELMTEYAAATGIEGTGEGRRYLWTDAFAVCNFLGLWRTTGREAYRGLALGLVDRVHHVLGRHRPDDPRQGWISGLEEAEGEARPTAGGLRIGKPENERPPEEPLDPQREWERDGQYYHYLTKWMHALHRVARETGEERYHIEALELAKAAHAAFVRPDPRTGRPLGMVWKKSIDLRRDLVPGMGQHDPLDGLITFATLQAESTRAKPPPGLDLSAAIEALASMCRGMSWATDDPLGAGGLLMDACRLGRLAEGCDARWAELLKRVLDEAIVSVQAFSGKNALALPAEYRLAFRELGLAIGLDAVRRLARSLEAGERRDLRLAPLATQVEALGRFSTLEEEIERFWMDPAHRAVETWTAHEDINAVMLATCLAPQGFFGGSS